MSGTTERNYTRSQRGTDRQRTLFLDMLATTCNVRKSAEAAGVSNVSVYRWRRADPAFAEQWRAALLTGYDRIEAALIRRALTVLGEEGDTVDRGNFDVEDALRLLHNHRSWERRPSETRVRAVRRATEAETDAAILKQLAALDRRAKAGKPV